MEEMRSWECPFYHRAVDKYECYDLHLVAMRMFEAPELVREEDRGPLNAMCEECKKYPEVDLGEIEFFRPRVCLLRKIDRWILRYMQSVRLAG